MMKMTKRRIRRLLTVPCLLLALCLTLSVTALAVNEVDDQGEVPKTALTVKPVVTIQGNVVVDNGKPTGYYELALCVRSARTIVDKDTGLEVSESAYAADVEANPDNAANYTVTYYPFSAAAATVGVNTDVLTAVNWDVTEVVYAAWDAMTGTYAANDTGYPRGIDKAANTDPEVWMGTDPDPFPDVTQARGGLHGNPVALSTAGDRSMFTATGQVDDYYESVETGIKTAIVTLSAHAPDNKPVVFTTDTPVAVVRFSYDLKRFPKTVVNEAYNNTHIDHDITGDNGDVGGFWLGFDRGDNNMVSAGEKTPLTWLADSAMGTGGSSFDFSDSKAATTEMGQVVWTKIGVANDAAGGWDETEYYYYLGAEGYSKYPGYKTIQVNVNGEPTAVSGVAIPMTEGAKVLAPGTEQNDTSTGDPAGYTYFKNLLRLGDSTLRLKMVNEPTFRRPTGISGPQILFYDWDDTLIGAMVVSKGDVRAQVNAYVEKNMVHPDLRTGDILQNELADTLPDLTTVTAATSDADGAAERYKAITDSLDREWTYRGKYSSKVDGSGVVRGENDPEPGKEYPLTNKLDYAFYRHLDTVTTLEYQNGGKTTTDRYITSEAVSSNADAALYPWVYGWAIVEDTSARNQTQWTVRRDAAQVEKVWTTFGTAGELDGLSPAYDLVADSKSQAVPTALPAGATPVSGTTVGGGTGIETTYPLFVDASAVTAPTVYSYALKDKSSYLRMADFSDVNALLTRPGQNVIIVKAVYEPGTELQEADYRIEEVPYYNRLNDKSASEGGAYSAVITLERANNLLPDGYMRGSMRVRDPAVRQDTTLDQKWIADQDRGVNNDLPNASLQTAKDRLETTYTKVDADNGESVTFTLALSARQNKVNYFLTEMYGYNFVTGGQRNDTNYNRYGLSHAIDNYNYLTNTTDDATNDNYYDKQGVYYQVARYEVREGSHGFVLYGTLNYVMEQATRVSEGKLTRAQFNAGTGYATLRDINLMLDNGATQPTAGNQNTFRDAIVLAAAECMYNHQGDPDFWNNDLDCAELTYHQLQHYISGNGLMTRAAADAVAIDWCHLHKDCFKDDQAAEAPKTWQEVLDAAGSPDKDKRDAISLLSGSLDGNIESITGLRANINGDAFSSGKTFQDKVVKAISDLNGAGRALSWANVQYAILYNSAPPNDVAGQNAALAAYWWYDGAKSKPAGATNLEELMAAVEDYRGVELKDGTTVGGWRFKLAGVDIAYTNMYTGTGNVGSEWLALTENLVHHVTEMPDGDQVTTSFYEEQSDYDIFEPTLMAALELALDSGADPTDQANFWPRLQYVLIHGSTTWPTAIPGDGSPEGTEMEDYWWRNDGKFMIVKDAQSMFTVAAILADPNPPADASAQKQRDAAQAAWDKFDAAKFADAAFGLFTNLRTTFDAAGRPTDDFAAFKNQVIAFVASGLVPDTDPTTNPDLWDQFQYYLVHNGTYEASSLMVERSLGYYWWKNGGTAGAPVSITGISDLATAGFSSKMNGNTTAWDSLSQNWINNRNFRNPDVASDTDGDGFYLNADLETDASANDKRYGKHTEMPQLSPADLRVAVEALVQDRYDRQVAADPTGHYHIAPAITWLDIQHYIVTGGDTDWTDDFADEAAAQARYWWHSGGINPNKETKTAVQSLMEDIVAAGGASYVTSLANAQLKADVADKLISSDVSLRVMCANAQIPATQYVALKTRLSTVLTQAGSDATNLTWYQLQYALLPATAAQGNGGNGAYQPDPDVARAWYLGNLTPAAGGGNTAGKFTTDWRPAWLKTKEGANAYVASLLALDMEEFEPEAAETQTAEDILARIEAMERELEALKEQLATLEETAEEVETPAQAPVAKPASTPAKPAAPVEQEPTTPEPETPEQVELPTVEPVTPAQSEPAPAPSYGEREETPMGEEAARQAVTVPVTEAAAPSPTLAMLEYKRYLNWLVRA